VQWRHNEEKLIARTVIFTQQKSEYAPASYKLKTDCMIKQVCAKPPHQLWKDHESLPHLLISTDASSAEPAVQLQLLIDICCPQGAQQQTRRPPLLMSINETDRWN